MSILSWDDFEDDEPKQAAQANQPAPVEPKKTTDSQVVSHAQHSSPNLAAAQPTRTNSSRATDPTDPLARASNALENLDVAPGLEELEMGAQRVQVDDKAMINCRADFKPTCTIQIRMGLAKVPRRMCKPLDAARSQHDSRHRIVEV